ncbi:sphingosine N-acyltransferase lac1 [Puccinia graminis f. sp. tritici]|uniref:Sphingosine N-acyltransferase lac1 n=1 Tax=Puccinia graminis f. sp. tritici TaxID=56615 RepID=A0A5B0NYM8_PUCGR|nr:sphingosine N-acyltransferase lac1 [Puccinia graminis f. sp. tritici]KAA1129788.1 sphingosine N-acyltransferase lac1 [Puccinia graminis f. sp. tritici]
MMIKILIFHILLLLLNISSNTASRINRYSSESETSISSTNSSSEIIEHGSQHQFGGEDVYSSKTQIRFNSPDLMLSPNHVITDKPRTLNYTFVVTNQTGAPDGFLRSMLVINGQYPGPLIEANEGDTINVLLVNRMNYPISIHWHGIHQKGTPWMDGVSECPIQPGVSFLYSFKIQGQFGTFWYHAHTRNLKADGIVGPLIVHSTRDPLVRGKDFDEEMVVFVSDWYHDTSTFILGEQLSTRGYNGSFAAPSPNSAILNGVGFFDCQRYAPGRQCQTRSQPLELLVRPNAKTRLRLVQSSSHALFRVSVDNHRLDIIEADATPVQNRFQMERVQIHGGERYSVILDTANDREGDAFYLRAAIDTDCLAWIAPGLDTPAGNTARAVIRVTNQKTLPGASLPLPRDSDWPPSSIGTCYDVDSSALVPRMKPPPMTDVVGSVYFNVSFGTIVVADQVTASERRVLGRFFVDNTTYIAQLQRPLLHHKLQGGQGWLNSSEVASETLPTPGVWDIVINNLDVAREHPFHLHGVDTCLVARGPGALHSKAANIQYNTETPVCRDVHVLPGNTYSVLRVQAYNPGVWFFHCHLGWHLGAGFAGVVVLQPDVLAQWQLPPQSRALCQVQNPINI